MLTTGAVLVTAALLTGCSGGAPITGGSSAAPQATTPVTPSASPTPTGPDPEAIRDVDFGDREWIWDTLGERYTVTLTDGGAEATDAYYDAPATFSLGAPVYSDANGDGLTDAALPLTWESGNGIAENWFIWLAQADAPQDPQQIPFPVASSARCGNASAALTPMPDGFRVEEVVRSSMESSAACAEGASMRRTREITVVGDGTGEGSWPATADGEGWGGYCPVKVYTEGEFAEAKGQLGPSADAPATSATGEKLYSPMQTYPFLQPEGWRLIGFLPQEQVDDSLVCVWVPVQK